MACRCDCRFLACSFCSGADFKEADAAYEAGGYQKAFRLFKTSAEKSHGQAGLWARHNVGLGKGIPQNGVRAYAWYRIAAAQGNKAARNLLRGITGSTSDKLAESQKLAAQY